MAQSSPRIRLPPLQLPVSGRPKRLPVDSAESSGSMSIGFRGDGYRRRTYAHPRRAVAPSGYLPNPSGCSFGAFGTMMGHVHQIPREHLRHTIRMSAERAKEARKEADRLACEAWNYRMLGYKGPAQPSPALGDALKAGYLYLEVRCLGCDTRQTVAPGVVRRPKVTRRALP
jgi:hypothetical protein